jgi:hypothetical protein
MNTITDIKIMQTLLIKFLWSEEQGSDIAWYKSYNFHIAFTLHHIVNHRLHFYQHMHYILTII